QLQPLRHGSDLLRLVAHALQIGYHLVRHQHAAQVQRSRRAAREQLDAFLVDLALHTVDARLVGDHLRRQLASCVRSASTELRICCSTSPPISSTRLRRRSSSASKCLDVCDIDMTAASNNDTGTLAPLHDNHVANAVGGAQNAAYRAPGCNIRSTLAR